MFQNLPRIIKSYRSATLLLALGKRLGVTQFHVSNLLPHYAETGKDILYEEENERF